MAYKLEAPPSTLTGALGGWLRKLHALVEAQPNFSLVSLTASETPNSRVTGLSGDISINIGSAQTAMRVWIMGGGNRSALTQQGWEPLTTSAVVSTITVNIASAVSALSGSGPPVSGAGGTLAPFDGAYYDSAQSPPVLYKQTSSNSASPLWVGIIMGDHT